MHHSLRRYLLAWIIGPIVCFVVFDTASLYRSALKSINVAYDRSLLASARSIGELLTTRDGRLQVDLPYTAIEIFTVGNAGRMVYRVDGFDGEFVSGYDDLPRYTGQIPQRSDYDALVDFVDVQYQGVPVRMAALYQPVTGAGERAVARIQVAETLEVREAQAREILIDTLWRQALLVVVIGLVTWIVVTRALRPVDAMRRELAERDERDLSALRTDGLPQELQPLVVTANELMGRLARLIGHQKQFVRDASHQLRTPLAVLKTQVQNGLKGHADAQATLVDMHRTVDRAIRLANQMLALAKVEQVQGEAQPERVDLREIAAEVALDLAPLIADRAIDFELSAPDEPAWIEGHPWMLRELTRNLLHNAIRATPQAGAIALRVADDKHDVQLVVSDNGPGIPPALREHLFEAFHTGHPTSGSGLGLTICREVCERMGGHIELVDRAAPGGGVAGLDAVASFPRWVAGAAAPQSAP